MSTELVSIADRLKAALTRNMSVLPPSSSRYITAENGVFTLPNRRTNETISGIILDFRKVFTYYRAAYNAANKTKPDCFAIGLDEEAEMRPAEMAPKPQHGGFCATCPHNQWKSGSNGIGKRCKNSVRIAILPPDSVDPADVLLLSLPPKSIKPFASYIANLAAKDLHPAQVITSIKLDPNEKFNRYLFDYVAPTLDIERLNAACNEADKLLTDVHGLVLDD